MLLTVYSVVPKPLLPGERAAARIVAHAQRHACARAAAMEVQRQGRLRPALRLRCTCAIYEHSYIMGNNICYNTNWSRK